MKRLMILAAVMVALCLLVLPGYSNPGTPVAQGSQSDNRPAMQSPASGQQQTSALDELLNQQQPPRKSSPASGNSVSKKSAKASPSVAGKVAKIKSDIRHAAAQGNWDAVKRLQIEVRNLNGFEHQKKMSGVFQGMGYRTRGQLITELDQRYVRADEYTNYIGAQSERDGAQDAAIAASQQRQGSTAPTESLGQDQNSSNSNSTAPSNQDQNLSRVVPPTGQDQNLPQGQVPASSMIPSSNQNANFCLASSSTGGSANSGGFKMPWWGWVLAVAALAAFIIWGIPAINNGRRDVDDYVDSILDASDDRRPRRKGERFDVTVRGRVRGQRYKVRTNAVGPRHP